MIFSFYLKQTEWIYYFQFGKVRENQSLKKSELELLSQKCD